MTPALESKAMTTSGLTFLKRLLDTPGPSGFETAPARAWREGVMTFADDVKAGVQELPNRRIVSRSIDNRIGAYVVAEVIRLLARDRPKHAAVFAVATTREEIAWTGGGARTSAVGLDPQVALVVDVTHATDYPGAEKKRAGDHKLGAGPVLARGSSVSPVVYDLLVECAPAPAPRRA